jgi:protein-S-isoprenylcysteine O-methyltransferase Ste14
MDVNRVTAYTLAVAAGLFGASSLALFGVFLLWGPLCWVALPVSRDAGALVFDGCLSLAFFIQHSVMVRRSFGARFERVVPERYHDAVYAIFSGVVLLAVVVLWQESPRVLVDLAGPWRWLLRVLIPAAAVVSAWGVWALRHFDVFGWSALWAPGGVRGEEHIPLVTGGPYRWVRHPIYLAIVLVIWSYPTLSRDRLLFNVLWTTWIVLAAAWEERDLIVIFGDAYRQYRRDVPMFVPWRGPRGATGKGRLSNQSKGDP